MTKKSINMLQQNKDNKSYVMYPIKCDVCFFYSDEMETNTHGQSFCKTCSKREFDVDSKVKTCEACGELFMIDDITEYYYDCRDREIPTKPICVFCKVSPGDYEVTND